MDELVIEEAPLLYEADVVVGYAKALGDAELQEIADLLGTYVTVLASRA